MGHEEGRASVREDEWPVGGGAGCADPLSGLAAIAAALQDARLSREVAELTERALAGRFYVACIGQFKRGKSTLVNALIGAPLLPTGVVPITTVPTVVRFGTTPGARIRLSDGGWQDIAMSVVARYVSEDQNPENAAGVTGVEVFTPAPLLRDGLCLVDTPGLGSVFGGNTAATTRFIPHIDAALVVIGADPPLAGDELELVRTVARQTQQLIVVLNKSDRVTDGERYEATRFAERMLTTALGRPPGPIYAVSATQALAEEPTSADWSALTVALKSMAWRSGPNLAQAGAARGAKRLVGECLRQIDQAEAALRQPLEQSERNAQALRHLVDEVAQRSLELRHLFEAEHEALASTFLAQREAFLQVTLPEAVGSITSAIEAMPVKRGPGLRRLAVRHVQALAREYVEPWLTREQEAAEEAYRAIAARFVTLGNGFLTRLVSSPDCGTGPPPQMLSPERGFRHLSHFTFHELPVLVAATARGQWWPDHVRTSMAARRAVIRDSIEYLTQLIAINTTRVQNDLDERVLESRRELEGEVEDVLRAASESAGRAATRARRAQESGSEAVADETARLAGLRRDVLAVQAAAGPR